MKRFLYIVLILSVFVFPVHGLDLTAPSVPESGLDYMPEDTESFSDGLIHILKIGIQSVTPELADAAGICMGLICMSLLISLLQTFPGNTGNTVELAGTLAVGMLLLKPTNVLIHLGIETVKQLSDYGKLLIPVMTTALAAQGGVASSTALYAGTAVFSAVLTGFISRLLVPMLYIFLCISIANSFLNESILKHGQSFVKWLMVWGLKIILYVFTGYMTITGVVSGSADASAVKAAKLTISGFVPVIGGILSDASESILVGASLVKNSIGVYGLLAVASVLIVPFLKVGVQYILLKVTASICKMFGGKESVALIHTFSTALGIILAMIGTIGLLIMIGTVCFMKGIS